MGIFYTINTPMQGIFVYINGAVRHRPPPPGWDRRLMLNSSVVMS